MRAALLFITLCFLSGCTQPIPPRELRRGPIKAVQRIAIDGEFSAEDVRELFLALNEKGDLEPLRPFLERSSDKTLEQLGEWFQRFWYREAHAPEGAMALLKRAVTSHTFSQMRESALRWSAETTFREEQSLTRALILRNEFKHILRDDLDFFRPALTSALEANFERSRPIAVSKEKAPSSDEILADFARLIMDERKGAEIMGRLPELESREWLPSFFNALTDLRTRHERAAFEGLHLGVARMLSNAPEAGTGRGFSSQLEQLVGFAASASQDSKGLFHRLKTLLESDTEFSLFVSETIQKWANKSLPDLDTPNLFTSLNRGLSLPSLTLVRDLKEIAFTELRVGTLSPQERIEILDELSEQGEKDFRRMLVSLFDTAQAFYALDTVDRAEFPTAFETYHSVLKRTNHVNMGWLSEIFSWASTTRLLSMKEGKPLFPAIHSALLSGSLVRTLSTISLLDPTEHDWLMAAWRSAAGSPKSLEGVDRHVTVFRDLWPVYERSARAFAARWDAKPLPEWLKWENATWRITRELLQRGFHDLPLHLVQQRLSRVEALEIVRLLKKLAADGSLARVFSLLGIIEDTSMQSLAQSFQAFAQSGECAALLDVLEIVLADAR